MYIYLIFVIIILGWVCYEIAKKKGRNKNVAFLVGCIFGLWGILYYLIAKGCPEYELEKADLKMRLAKARAGK